MNGVTAVGIYSFLGHYDPATGANDNGLDSRSVLNYLQSPGITDLDGLKYPIGPYFFAEPGDLVHYNEISFLTETPGIAWNFTTQMMDQFDRGQPWQYVTGQTIEGGHYTVGPGPKHALTWTRNQPWTDSCYTHNAVELSAYITAERYNAVTGATLEHFKDADLERYLVLWAQTKLGIT